MSVAETVGKVFVGFEDNELLTEYHPFIETLRKDEYYDDGPFTEFYTGVTDGVSNALGVMFTPFFGPPTKKVKPKIEREVYVAQEYNPSHTVDDLPPELQFARKLPMIILGTGSVLLLLRLFR